jgi:hypothetical protein
LVQRVCDSKGLAQTGQNFRNSVRQNFRKTLRQNFRNPQHAVLRYEIPSAEPSDPLCLIVTCHYPAVPAF